MVEAYNVVTFTFKELAKSANVEAKSALKAVEAIAQQLRVESGSPDYSYLHDRLDYKQLVELNFEEFPNFGRFFLLQFLPTKKYVGFLLCLDDMDSPHFQEVPHKPTKVKQSDFPIDHCAQFIDHDLPFLKDLYHLKNFGFIFQIGIQPEHQRRGGGRALIDEFEVFYQGWAHILGGSIHEQQYSIFKLLQKRKDNGGQYIFLDHYFDLRNRNQHWFRVVKLLDPRIFFKKINPDNLPNTYHTVIPIQLNQAVSMVNDIIGEMDAKILWSSFFNSSDLLQKRFNMGKDDHGFFESVLETNSREQYKQILPLFQDVTDYLRSKDSQSDNVASLTESFKNESYEVFFFNEQSGIHDLGTFNNPISFSLEDEDKLLLDFLRHLIIQRRREFELISVEDKKAWFNSLHRMLRATSKTAESDKIERAQNWAVWKKRLLIDDEQEEILRKGILALKETGSSSELSEQNREEIDHYRKLIKEINRQSLIPLADYEKWQKYLALHKKLYEIDCLVLENPQDYWWCHAMIPINYSGGGNVVGIMFTFRCKKLPPEHKDYHRRMGKLASLISSSLSKNMLNILIKLQQKATSEAANRYAIAAITSRNLAHNYGSHILTRLDSEVFIQRLMKKELEGNFAEELARFLAYLRTRTTLLADMSTSEPVSTASCWLKQEVLEQFNRQILIKKYISNSHIEKIDINYRVAGRLKSADIEVQIPNGDLGASALYMILENLIRNSAKYENISNIETLEISLDVLEQDERGYHIAIYDHIPRPEPALEALVGRINERYIKKRAIDLRNDIRGSGWGILEMRAAASYLRKKVPGVVIGEDTKRIIPLLRADKIGLPDDQAGGRLSQQTLAYRIYLKKPRTVLLVDLHDQLPPTTIQTAVRRSDLKLIRSIDSNRQPKQVHSHTFTVFFDAADRAKIETHKRFPHRWILLDQAESQEKFNALLQDEGQSEGLLLWLWEQWLNRYCRNKNLDYRKLRLHVPVLDQQYSDASEVLSHSENWLLYDDHEEWQDKNPDFPLYRLGFYQSHRSMDPLGVTLYNTRSLSSHQKELLKKELLEAAITEVIIIDERIQYEAIQQRKNNRHGLFAQLPAMNVHLPDPEAGGPDLYAMHQSDSLAHWLKGKLSANRVDFIVLHLGILEAWAGSDMPTISNWIREYITKIDNRPEIILTSGRGKPHNFPIHNSFQLYNNIARHLIESAPSKYHLCKTLFSSRTRMGI